MTNSILIIAAVILGEARGEHRHGMEAVAAVIVNRATERGQSPVRVVTAPRQFSSWHPGLVARMRRDPGWNVAESLARRVITDPSSIPDRTGGANHFDVGVPRWARGRTPTARIGNHTFWKL